jgi:hypothetical protein
MNRSTRCRVSFALGRIFESPGMTIAQSAVLLDRSSPKSCFRHSDQAPNSGCSRRGPLLYCSASCAIMASRATRLNPGPLDDTTHMFEQSDDAEHDDRKVGIHGRQSDRTTVLDN